MSISLLDQAEPNISWQAGESVFDLARNAVNLAATGVDAIFELSGKYVKVSANSRTLPATVENYINRQLDDIRYRKLHSPDGRIDAMLESGKKHEAQKVGAHMDIKESLDQAAAKSPEEIVRWLKAYITSDIYPEIEFGPIKHGILSNQTVSEMVMSDNTKSASLLREVMDSLGDRASVMPERIIQMLSQHEHTTDYYKAEPEVKEMLEALAELSRATGTEMKVPSSLIENLMDGPSSTHYITSDGSTDILRAELSVDISPDPKNMTLNISSTHLDNIIKTIAAELGYNITPGMNGDFYIQSPAGTTRDEGIKRLTEGFKSKTHELTAEPDLSDLGSEPENLKEGHSRGQQIGQAL